MFWRKKTNAVLDKIKIPVLNKPGHQSRHQRLATPTSSHIAFTAAPIPPGSLTECVAITGDWWLVWPHCSCRSATTPCVSKEGSSVTFRTAPWAFILRMVGARVLGRRVCFLMKTQSDHVHGVVSRGTLCAARLSLLICRHKLSQRNISWAPLWTWARGRKYPIVSTSCPCVARV